MISALKAVEGGRKVRDVCREYGNSDATFYTWKSKIRVRSAIGGLSTSDVRRLKDLEDENQRLKRMFADLSLKARAR